MLGVISLLDANYVECILFVEIYVLLLFNMPEITHEIMIGLIKVFYSILKVCSVSDGLQKIADRLKQS